MILAPNSANNSRSRLKKALYLDNVDEDNSLASSLSCEFGPDGINFGRHNIRVTRDGMCQIKDDQITPLSIVKADEIEFGAEIGRGASGVVQEGIYKPQNMPIAIKTISIYDRDKRRQLVNDLQNFLHDRLEQVRGNNIELSNYLVQVYGAYYDEGSIKIILELMDAGSLRSLLNMAKKMQKAAPYVEEPYLANIAYQILSGLHYIHTQKKQIHRDIKPENVLINSLGHVKLSDFGISKTLEKTTAFSKTFVGTVTYMSPERLVGDPYGFSSDLWSLGLILIELATGEYPYKKTKKFIEMLQSIRNLPEPNLPNNGLYSDSFRDFIAKCLQKDPKRRSTAAELLEHPWLVENSELNLDISDWVCNILFGCNDSSPEFGVPLDQMDTVCDDRIFYEDPSEEKKSETPSFIDNKVKEFPRLQRYHSFGDVYDTNSNLVTQASTVNFQDMNRTPSANQVFGKSGFYTSKSKDFSFDENDMLTPKSNLTMDLEVENIE